MKPQTEQEKGLDQQKEPIVPPPSPKSRLPLLLTFIFLVVLILVGGYKLMSASSTPPPQPTPQPKQLSPSPSSQYQIEKVDDTTNKYKDLAYGYEISYPANWNIKDSTNIRNDVKEWLSFSSEEMLVSVAVKELEQTTSLNDFSKNFDPFTGPVHSQELSNLNTYEALFTWEEGPIGPVHRRIYLTNNKYFYVISIEPNSVVDDSTVKQILSTFTFLDQGNTTNENQPFPLNDSDADYNINGNDQNFTLSYIKNGQTQVIYIGRSSVDLEQYIDKQVLVEGKFRIEKKTVECFKAPCPPIEMTVLDITTVQIKQ